jgi:hypothetical protein
VRASLVPQTDGAGGDGNRARQFIFWNDIADSGKNDEEFLNEFLEAARTEKELASELVGHIRDIAKVAKRKFTLVTLSISLAVPGALLVGLALILRTKPSGPYVTEGAAP